MAPVPKAILYAYALLLAPIAIALTSEAPPALPASEFKPIAILLSEVAYAFEPIATEFKPCALATCAAVEPEPSAIPLTLVPVV